MLSIQWNHSARGDTAAESTFDFNLSMSTPSDEIRSSRTEIAGQGGTNVGTDGCPIPEAKAPCVTKRVIESDDILPTILSDLKELLIQDSLNTAAADQSGLLTTLPKWKGPFCAFLLVNKSFLHAGSDMLWSTMEHLAPVFALLPWYKKSYVGLGTFGYTGYIDWERFSFYASRIQRLNLRSCPDQDFLIPSILLSQLLMLHGRPDPLFPRLQSIVISPHAFPGLPMLFLLSGKSMDSLTIASCSEIVSGYAKIPSDWQTDETSGNGALANLLAVFPRVSYTATELQSFDYRGPVSEEFFHHLSSFTSIISLKLTMTNGSNVSVLKKLRQLTLLRRLSIEGPFLSGSVERDEMVSNNQFFRRMKSLHVAAKDAQLLAVWWILHPRKPREIALKVIGETESLSFYNTIATHLQQRNRELQCFSIAFVAGTRSMGVTQGRFPPHFRGSSLQANRTAQARMSQAGIAQARQSAVAALSLSKNLEHIVINNIPKMLAHDLAWLLHHCMSFWDQLTELVFLVNTESSPSHSTNNTFPHFFGLSILGDVIWKCNLKLERLEIHLDGGRIVDEDLLGSETFKLTQGSPAATLFGHRLRVLKIHTLKTNGRTLDLGPKRKVEIAMYLDRLFPQLEVVQGSAEDGGVWEEIEILVKSYQAVKKHVYAQVEAM